MTELSPDVLLLGALLLLIGVFIGILIKVRSQRILTRNLEEISLNERDVRSRWESLNEEYLRLREVNHTQQQDLLESEAQLRATLVRLEHAEHNLRAESEKSELRSQEMKKEFELLSNKIFKEKGREMLNENSRSMEEILRPFKDRMLELQQKVERTHLENSKDRSGLKEKINELHRVYLALSDDAKNLTKALKSDVKQQGNWGEMVLERVLQSSNLRAGEEYERQYSTKDEDGKQIYPDFVVHLPDGKHLIIDSKVSLVHYESFVNAEDEDTRNSALKLHLNSVKTHIKGLSEKNYPAGQGLQSPDFVLMFVPIEASFALAIQADKEIFDYAWKRKVVIVSPSTLLATLRTVASLWQMERQNRNAEEIAKQAGGLYEKFNNLLQSIQDIGKHIERSQSAYSKAFGQLASGPGNVLRRVEKLREMGAETRASKAIDMEAVERELQRVGTRTAEEESL